MTLNRMMASNPVKNVGTENPTIDTNVPTWSNQEYCRYAETMPMGKAIRMPTTYDNPTTHSVCGNAFRDDVHHRAPRRVRDHARSTLRVADFDVERPLHEVQRLVYEELLHPLRVADGKRLVEAEGLADLRPDLGRDGERQLPRRIAGR